MEDAPELQNIQDWINTAPVTLDTFDDTIVLLFFWRYTSASCHRTLQYIRQLWDRYGGDQFTVIGVHTPAFDFEQDASNVRDAVDRLDIEFPVALDTEKTTWERYGGRYWPRYTLVDQQGRIREEHVGVGGYARLEERIRRLIRWDGGDLDEPLFESETDAAAPPENDQFITSDIYAGAKWGNDLGNGDFHTCSPYARMTYRDEQPDQHELNRLYVNGEWIREADHLYFTDGSDRDGYVTLRFSGRICHAVMAAETEARITITMDGEPVPAAYRGSAVDEDADGTFVRVDRPDTYQLVAQDTVDIAEITLQPQDPFRCYAFTFE